jgi:hypothetical protein
MAYQDHDAAFIDAHCHLFNIADIPLYESALGKVQMGTIQSFLVAIGAGAAIGGQELPDAIKKQRNFIRFFERDISANIEWLAKEMSSAVLSENEISNALRRYGFKGKRIIATPLVMDFDTSLSETDIGKDVSCESQVIHLFEAIHASNSSLEIYPFAGFALDKLDQDGSSFVAFQQWWKRNSIPAEERVRGKSTMLPGGRVIGIKLYPPLGFNPYPDSSARERYVEFFQWCVDADIPITVHCQKSSFTAAQHDQSLMTTRTDPHNWDKLLSEHPELSSLRINFGHFGGSEQLKQMMKEATPDTAGRLRDSWTYTVCKLLCKYPNTYADISAFGFDDADSRMSLASLLGGAIDLPDGSWLPNQQAIANKLIWGSDIPMIISSPSFLDQHGKPSYLALLKKLYLCLLINKPFQSTRQSDSQILFNKLTRSNPSEFLFGQKL